MILLEDNNDSFTYNIVELLRNITNEEIDVVPHCKINTQEILHKYNHIIISPGAGVPGEYPVIEEILNIYAGKIPILGICLGHQAIALHYGAEIKKSRRIMHGEPSIITCDSRSTLFKGMKKTTAGRYHSWEITNLPECMKITAISDDDGCIMGTEHKQLPVYGIQFHPESYISTNGREIISNFLKVKTSH